MIRINLLGEKVDNSRIYALQILGFSAAVCITVMCCIGVQIHVSSELASAKIEKEHFEKQLADLKKVTKQVAELEQKKKLLAEKLTTIANLKAKKHGPIHVIDDLNLSIPERAWLTAVKEKGGEMRIEGVAMDNQTVAQFMRKLEASEYFGNVNLIEATQKVVDNVKIKEFALSVALKNPKVVEAPKFESVSGKKPAAPAEQKKTEETVAS